MKTIIKWFLLLNKRLYKKITFVIILALIPLVVLGLSIVAKGESGFVKIALAQRDKNDAISNAIIDDLSQRSNLMSVEVFDTPQEATEAVKTGKCDTAWIFAENLSEKTKNFAENPGIENAMVHVVERQQNVLLRITHEKLSCVLYKHVSPHLYISYIRSNVAELETLSNEQLMEYYDSYLLDGELFEFSTPAADGMDASEISYLVTPVRGLLSVLVVLCAMASAMFFVQDQKSGTFAWVAESQKKYIEFLCQAIAVLNVSVAMVIALAISRLTVGWAREILVLLLYVVACSLFGMLLRNVFCNNKILGALIPLLITIMIALCPVFFEWRQLKWLQMLFPPTYYINAVYSTNYVKYMIVYIVVCTLLIFVVQFVNRMITQLRFANRKR